jgi:hypothetical protein
MLPRSERKVRDGLAIQRTKEITWELDADRCNVSIERT